MSQSSAIKWIANSDKTCLKIIQKITTWSSTLQGANRQMAHCGNNFYFLEVQEAVLILHTIDLRGQQADSSDQFQLEVIDIYTNFTFEIEVNECNIALRLNKAGVNKTFIASLKNLTNARYLADASNVLQSNFHPLNPNYFLVLTAPKFNQLANSQVNRGNSKTPPDSQILFIYDLEKPDLILHKIIFRSNFDLKAFTFPHKDDIKDTLIYLLNKNGTVYFYNLLLDQLQVNQTSYEYYTQNKDYLKKQATYKLTYAHKSLVQINQLEELHQISTIKDQSIKNKLRNSCAILKRQGSVYVIFSQGPEQKLNISILSQTQKLIEVVYQCEINLERSEFSKLQIAPSQQFNVVYAQIGKTLIVINYNALVLSNTNDIAIHQVTIGECSQYLLMNYCFTDTIFMKKTQFEYLNQSQLYLLEKDDVNIDFRQIDESVSQQQNSYLDYKHKLEDFKKSIKNYCLELEQINNQNDLEQLNKTISKSIERDFNSTARIIKQEYNLLYNDPEIQGNVDEFDKLNNKIDQQKRTIQANNEQILKLLDNNAVSQQSPSQLQNLEKMRKYEQLRAQLEQEFLNEKYDFEQIIQNVSEEDLEYIENSLGDWIENFIKEKQ